MRRRKRPGRFAALMLDARTIVWLGRWLLRPALTEARQRSRRASRRWWPSRA
jgi:hypothetical protein